MFLIEAAITTVEEARAAVEAGADRLELCTTLEVGGVTPSTELFLQVRESVAIPVWVLVRPRAGDFRYSPDEFAALKRDAAWFLNNGADGIVVGVLNADRTIDRGRNEELAQLADGKVVFHRAFDCVTDRLASLELLIELGYRRILTSGGAAAAIEGADELADLIRAARGRIEILPGGGIGPANAADLIRRTGCTQLHGSFRGGKPNADPEQIRALHSVCDSARVNR